MRLLLALILFLQSAAGSAKWNALSNCITGPGWSFILPWTEFLPDQQLANFSWPENDAMVSPILWVGLEDPNSKEPDYKKKAIAFQLWLTVHDTQPMIYEEYQPGDIARFLKEYLDTATRQEAFNRKHHNDARTFKLMIVDLEGLDIDSIWIKDHSSHRPTRKSKAMDRASEVLASNVEVIGNSRRFLERAVFTRGKQVLPMQEVYSLFEGTHVMRR